MYTAICIGSVEAAVFDGGSNAGKLAQSNAALGLDVYQIIKAGWKLTKKREQANSEPDGSFGQCSARHPFRPLFSGQLELHGTERGGEHLSAGQLRGMMAFTFRGASRRTGQSHQTCPGSAEEGGGSLWLSPCVYHHTMA
jgi:hypothetical protein